MNRSYYTSLCRVWLDHEVLSNPDEREWIMEMLTNKNDINERFCEEVINKLQTSEGKTQATVQLLDHLIEIDFTHIAKLLCDEYIAN